MQLTTRQERSNETGRIIGDWPQQPVLEQPKQRNRANRFCSGYRSSQSPCYIADADKYSGDRNAKCDLRAVSGRIFKYYKKFKVKFLLSHLSC